MYTYVERKSYGKINVIEHNHFKCAKRGIPLYEKGYLCTKRGTSSLCVMCSKDSALQAPDYTSSCPGIYIDIHIYICIIFIHMLQENQCD